MYWAAERRSGKIVKADAAKTWGEYRCPTCKAEVFLRSGQRRANHFAHMPGQGKPDCEFFHYSGVPGRAPQTSGPQPQPRQVEPLSLSIELDPEPQKHGPRRWRLRLTVPRAPDEHGQIAINLGDGDTRKISLAKLSIGPETYTVSLDELDFGASWVSPEVSPEYRDAVRHRLLGLDSKKGNTFAAAHSKLKPRQYSLSWGESYYFVWRTDRGIAVPDTLTCKPLARVDDWECVLIALPHDPDEDVEAWIRDQCDSSIDRSTREWAVIYPPPYGFGDDGDIQIPWGDEIVLALKPDNEVAAGELTCSTGQAPAIAELHGARQQLVSIRINDGVTADHLYIGWNGNYVATLRNKPYPAKNSEIAVTIHCAGPQGQVNAQLHTATAQALLSAVRLGRLSLTAVHGHPVLRGQLSTRSRNSSDWLECKLSFATSGLADGTIDSDLLFRLNSALLDTSLDIQLDFGPFGAFTAGALHVAAALPHSSALSCPKILRTRIEWLSRACNSFVDKNGQPIATLSDRYLLMHLDTLHVPANLLAHRRAIDSELKALQIRGGHD